VSASTTAQSWIRPCLLAANYGAPVVLIATRFQYPWLIAAAICAHAAFFYAIVAPGCGWLGPVATRFAPQGGGNEVWLTIDDGPAGRATLELSEEMVRRGVRATFFVKGENLAREPEVGSALLAAGHTLANHTQTHPSRMFWWLRPGRLRAEIDGCNEALKRAGVAALRWFRSPVGLKNVYLQPALAQRAMRFVGWSVRGHDGVFCDPEAVARRVGAEVTPGAIVLLHEGRPRSNEAILRVIDELRARGYSFVIPGDDQLV
jgi:peptidoglycan-N-acetylglucosamine deacetylase